VNDGKCYPHRDRRKSVAKSKAESFKETIMSALEDETEDEAIADASKAAARIYVERAVRPQELSQLVEQALDGKGERFRLNFDDGSDLYLTTTGGILTATVSK
jgi:DNA-binding NarL/FixJ family response regulator